MILKSSVRGFTGELARHLSNTDENERARIVGMSDHFMPFDDMGLTMEEELKLYFAQMDLMAAAHKKNHKHINHISMSPHPDYDIGDQQYQQAWDIYEQEYDLVGHPYVEVEHSKEGRTHRHRAYYALDEKGRYMRNSNNYARNEKIARILEFEFGHKLTKGRHNVSVQKWLLQHGNEAEQEVAQAMEQAGLMYEDRPAARETLEDKRIADRTGLERPVLKDLVMAAYQTSDTGKSFETALAQHQIYLAAGDTGSRRSRAGKFIIVDKDGVPTALSKCGIKVKEFQEKFRDIKIDHLPGVQSVKKHLAEQEKDTERGDQEGEAGGAEKRNYKEEYQLLREDERSEWKGQKDSFKRLKIVDDEITRDIQNDWKRYHAAKAPYLEKVNAKYEKRKQKIKEQFKPRWRKLFRQHNADMYRASKGVMNVGQKLILAYKYRKEIRREYPKAFGKHIRFIFDTRKQMEMAIERHKDNKDALFNTYIKKLEKERKRVMDKSREQRKIEQLKSECKALVAEKREKQKVIREAKRQAYVQQKIRDKKRRDDLSLSIKSDIAARTGKPIIRQDSILPEHDVQIYTPSIGKDKDNENER